MTGAETVKVRPQLSVTVGKVGSTANAGQEKVADPEAGIVTIGALIVYVYTQGQVVPEQLVYVYV